MGIGVLIAVCGVWAGSSCLGCLRAAKTPLVDDPNFERGFLLSDTDSTKPPRTAISLFADTPERPPVWKLAQWGSRHDLATATVSQSGNTRTYANKGSRVCLTHEGDTAILELGISGKHQYAGQRCARGEGWPHLLAEQSFENTPALAELKALKVAFDIAVDPARWRSKGEPDPHVDAAQYVMYFTVQNRNRLSEGFGDYLWFGVPLYDVRYPMLPAYRSADAGKSDATGKYIYTPPASDYWKKPIGDGRWHVFAADLLPAMRAAFADAQAKGFLKNCRWEDMAVGAMNTGWELPGPYDARARLRNLAVIAFKPRGGRPKKAAATKR